LPGAVRELGRLVAAPDLLAHGYVLAHEPDGPGVEIRLRRDPRVGAVGESGVVAAEVAVERAPARGAVGREQRRSRRAALFAPRPRHAEAEAVEGAAAAAEGPREQAPGHLHAVVGVGVGAGAVERAVEDAELVREPAAEHLAV